MCAGLVDCRSWLLGQISGDALKSLKDPHTFVVHDTAALKAKFVEVLLRVMMLRIVTLAAESLLSFAIDLQSNGQLH